MLKDEKAEVKNTKRIVAEMIQPPKKEKKKEVQKRIRKVESASSQNMASGMKFKFTPDLGVEGGEGVAVASNQNLDAVVFEEGETDEDAVGVYTPGVDFPPRARELGIEGLLEVIIVIGVDGKVTSIDVTTTPHASITSEARKVISKWRFKPAQNQGVPVKIRKKVEFEFRLNS